MNFRNGSAWAIRLCLSCLLLGLGACQSNQMAAVNPSDRLQQGVGPLEPLEVPLIIAHRGYSAIAPENTAIAVELGVQSGADFVEIDVQMSADGEVVLMHDATLTRTTNAPLRFPLKAPWNTGDFLAAELYSLDAGTWFGYSRDPLNFAFAGEPVPSLVEILELLTDRAGLLLEVKSPGLYPGIEEAIARDLEVTGWVRDGVATQALIVQSFDWESMRTYANLHPQVPVGLLGNPPQDEATWTDVAGYADWINPGHTNLSPDVVADIHRRGFRTSPYTINDAPRMRELLDMGVDGVITDQPARLKLLRDGQRPPQGEFVAQNPAITEMSGLANSPLHPGVFYALNDSGDQPRIFLFDQQGRDLGTLPITGALAVDWEDMASYRQNGRGYLVIADVGDNEAVRPFVNLYTVEEPAVTPPLDGPLNVLRHMIVQYPDGARDCEGVAVDPVDGHIYLLSKRDALPRLYRVPLEAQGLVTAEYLGEVGSLPLPESGRRQAGITQVSPTAFAFSDDGQSALIVTLDRSYVYSRAREQTWLEALNQPPRPVLIPDYPQIEAGDFSFDGQHLLIGSEMTPAPLYGTAL